MKYIKNFLYSIIVFLAIGTVMVLSTALIQIATEIITEKTGNAISDELLFTISGGLGVAVTGIATALFVKKKNYTNCIEIHEPFRLKTCAYYCAVVFCVLSVLYYAVTTFLFVNVFSMTEEVQVATEIGLTDFILVNVIFSVLIAPVVEELLFRVGLYSLLRHRFGVKFSVVVCTVTFAVIHGYSVQGFCSCLLGGLLFMLIYIRTGNIKYSIAAHMICNLDATILNLLEDNNVTLFGIPIQYEIDGFNMVHPIFIVVAALFCIVCIIKKLMAKNNTIKEG